MEICWSMGMGRISWMICSREISESFEQLQCRELFLRETNRIEGITWHSGWKRCRRPSEADLRRHPEARNVVQSKSAYSWRRVASRTLFEMLERFTRVSLQNTTRLMTRTRVRTLLCSQCLLPVRFVVLVIIEARVDQHGETFWDRHWVKYLLRVNDAGNRRKRTSLSQIEDEEEEKEKFCLLFSPRVRRGKCRRLHLFSVSFFAFDLNSRGFSV